MVDGDDRFCAATFGKMQALGPPQVACCGQPLPHDADTAALCGRLPCRSTALCSRPHAFCTRWLSRQLVLSLKHAPRLHLARMMARTMLREVCYLPDNTVILTVPSYRLQLRQRGFNQAAQIASQLAQQSGRPLAIDAIDRIKPTPTTKGLGRRARPKNVAGAFHVVRLDQISGRSVVLVDDLMPTGATVFAWAIKTHQGRGATSGGLDQRPRPAR